MINRKDNSVPKFGTFKFGQPIRFYFLLALIDYLPKFIVINKLCKDILTSIAISMVRWYNGLKKLQTVHIEQYSDALKYANSDSQIFLSRNSSKEEIINAINNIYAIHQNRGKEQGIRDDISRLAQGLKEINYYPWTECGWWLDQTFPEYSSPTETTLDGVCRLDLDNLLEVTINNNSGYSDNEVIDIIRKEFVPLTINLNIIIIKPHIITWFDIKNTYRIKFGTFKFGEVIQ